MKKQFFCSVLMFLLATANVIASEQFVVFKSQQGTFQLSNDGKVAPIVIADEELPGVRMAAESLQQDLYNVTDTKPEISSTVVSGSVIVGTIESPLIKQYAKSLVSQLKGKREMFLLTVSDGNLIIAGSDKRGAIYGIYELSRQIGVSPWYWFMDVPIQKHSSLYINKGVFTDGEPKVEYRGIFINDEWPSFGNWANSHFGGINSKCYKHIFELLLRMKANFMWPAMWGSAFFDDDPENGPLADKMGIVMSTSHHEPLNLAQQDWKRQGGTEKLWNYMTNEEGLKKFWRGGMERSKNWETIVTVGMRGDGDMEMPDADDNKALLERIVKDQRQIISDVTGKPASETPQVWALYKEVQDYYDQGMKVPDDVTLLLCDDNWGNIRRVPSEKDYNHAGGFGMYYHFDYVGAPRCSKWININPIPRVWEQMNLAYEHNIRKIWIVNVGDLKPMEYPIQFFLDMAWDPTKFNKDNLREHSVDFCRSVFGDKYAEQAAYLLRTYAKFNRRVAPELLSATTYSFNYNEWERVCGEYNLLREEARQLEKSLPAEMQSTYFQLLGMPIEGVANLYNLYYAQAMNKRLAKKKNPVANLWADRVKECFMQDAKLTMRYHQLENGKWDHMMDEVRIGYTSWNTPAKNIMPDVQCIEGIVPEIGKAEFPVAVNYEFTSRNPQPRKSTYAFKEVDGYVSIEAEHYSRATNAIGKNPASWVIIPELGRTLSGLTTQPVRADVDGMALEYDFTTTTSCEHAVFTLRLSATLNYVPGGQSYAISVDGCPEKIIDINSKYNGEIGEWQRHHVIDTQSISSLKAGKHTLRIRPLNNGIVIQKILINLGGLHKSFLGPQETVK